MDFSLKNDRWINNMAEGGMITPFVPSLIRKVSVPFGVDVAGNLETNVKAISYGLSSYGYDIRLSPKEFKIFRDTGATVNPKNFTEEHLQPAKLHRDEWGEYFILPGNSYGLGVALERLQVPSNITIITVGKSTYARCGIIANITPAEASWRGHLTLEFSNSSSAACRIYANEGVVQLLFLQGVKCQTDYAQRQGKYQNQTEEITLPRL